MSLNAICLLKAPILRRWMAAITLALTAVIAVAVPARAQDDAAAILKSMSDYLASQKTISLAFDADIEVITPDIQKIQFASSGRILLSRPDKLRATRTGGYADVELVFDGKTATLFGKHLNAFTRLDAAGSVEQLVDLLRHQYMVELPGADLLSGHVYDDLIQDVLDAKHIGRGVIDGVECEHLAFRNQDTDWQLWVEIGERPIPRKYVITSKAVTGGPQYTLRIRDWKTDAQIGADAFAFSPPAGAKQVEITALSGIDEVPPGISVGGQQ
jgi:hypothetical protein